MTEPVDVEEIKTQINAIVKNPVYSDRVVALIPVYKSLNVLAAERGALKAEVERLREVLRQIAAIEQTIALIEALEE